MTHQEILNKITQITAEKFEVKIIDVTPNTAFIDDLNGDSLDEVELITEFEKALNIHICDEIAENIHNCNQAAIAIMMIKQNKSIFDIVTELKKHHILRIWQPLRINNSTTKSTAPGQLSGNSALREQASFSLTSDIHIETPLGDRVTIEKQTVNCIKDCGKGCKSNEPCKLQKPYSDAIRKEYPSNTVSISTQIPHHNVDGRRAPNPTQLEIEAHLSIKNNGVVKNILQKLLSNPGRES